jgi:ribosomal protein L11 methyltransferase
MENDIYIEVAWQVEPLLPGKEILVALMAEFEYESFVDSANGLVAYIKKSFFNENDLLQIQTNVPEGITWSFTWKEIPNENWNAAWESSFEPVDVIGKLRIRAPFHQPDTQFPYEVIISPKMAFGTGHHETTWLISKALLNNPPIALDTLDMGCGTGVLAILAKMLGAAKTVAIDIDPWSVENTVENMELNNIAGIEVKEGGAEAIAPDTFDLILANINRNILVQDMKSYAQALRTEAKIMFSGFFISDADIIKESAANCGLDFISLDYSGDWAMMTFKKRP